MHHPYNQRKFPLTDLILCNLFFAMYPRSMWADILGKSQGWWSVSEWETNTRIDGQELVVGECSCWIWAMGGYGIGGWVGEIWGLLWLVTGPRFLVNPTSCLVVSTGDWGTRRAAVFDWQRPRMGRTTSWIVFRDCRRVGVSHGRTWDILEVHLRVLYVLGCIRRTRITVEIRRGAEANNVKFSRGVFKEPSRPRVGKTTTTWMTRKSKCFPIPLFSGRRKRGNGYVPSNPDGWGWCNW